MSIVSILQCTAAFIRHTNLRAMNEIIIEAVFNATIPTELLYLIQKQKEYIDELFHQGIVSDYSVSRDKKVVWVTFVGKTAKEVALLMDGFPLINFIEYHFKTQEV